MMQRQHKPTDLAVHAQTSSGHGISASATSPINIDLSSLDGDFGLAGLGLSTLPPLPQSPPASPRVYHRDTTKSLLSGFKSKKASDSDQRKIAHTTRDVDDDCRPATSSMSKVYHLRKNPGSTPELHLVRSADSVAQAPSDANLGYLTSSPALHFDDEATKRKERYFRNPLSRTKSIRRDSNSQSRPDENTFVDSQPGLVTSQSHHDMLGAEIRANKSKEKEKRAKSAERLPAGDSDENHFVGRRDKDIKGGIKAGSKTVMSKAKSGGGHFLNRLGKIGRRGSSTDKEKDIPDSEYQFKVINLPLIEQTRITRISKRLTECRDKTEFWMPSLPWRCIDYLNSKCENEGLYRVPGSGPHVKHWQRRFDTELDIDLLAEELYDPNEVASMLKAWLRDLPTEIMPLTLQHDLAAKLEQENPRFKNVGEQPSQILRDVLSDLPPFNYYLLFAVTCHLSLLLANQEHNKMDLNNLAICVLPCLNLERWLFNYLVGEWRLCWQGCFTEKETLKSEDAYERGLLPGPDHDPDTALNRSMATAVIDDAQSDVNTMTDDGAGSTGDPGSKPTSSYGDSKDALRTNVIDTLNQSRLPLPSSRAQLNAENGFLGVGAEDERLRRPHTAGHQKHYAENQRAAHRTPIVANQGSARPNRHSRSQSDLVVAPVVAGYATPKQSTRS